VPHDHALKHDSFLPDLQDGVPGPCHDSSSVALRKHLARLSSPAKCEVSQQLTTDNVGYGFGSVVNSWVKPYMAAVDKGLSFWSPPLGSYADGKGGGGKKGSSHQQHHRSDSNKVAVGERCEVDSMACWFKPLSECEAVEHLVGEPSGCRNTDKATGRHSSKVRVVSIC
jgi:hypothetical protein